MSEEKFKSNQHEEVMKELREMGSSLGDLGLQKFDDVPEDFWVKQEDAIFQKLHIKQNVKSSSKISCLLYTSPSPRDLSTSRMPSSA